MDHYGLSSWAWSQGGLTSTEKLLLQGLVHHCRGGKLYCWPSRERLQNLVGLCSPQEVSRYLGRLKRKNVITPYRIPREHGNGHHNGWLLMVEGCGNAHFDGCRNPHQSGTHTNIGRLSKNGRVKPDLENQAGGKAPVGKGRNLDMLKVSGKKGKPVKAFGTLADVIPAGMLEPGDIDEVVAHHTPDGPWRKGKVGMFWLSLLGTVFPKETHPKAINAKDSAMLWQCLDGGLGAQDLANLVLYWQIFADEVKFRQGVTPAARPSIGFLAKYKHIAMGMTDKLRELRDKKNLSNPVQLIAQPGQMRDNAKQCKKGVVTPEPATSDDTEHFALDGTKVTKW